MTALKCGLYSKKGTKDEHAEAGHAAGHGVGMVAENTEGVGADGPAGYVEHAGEELAADFVHGGIISSKPWEAV